MILRVLGATLLLSGSAWAQSVVVGSGAEEQVLANSQVWLAPEGIQVQSGGSLVVAGSSSGAPGTITSGVTAGVPISVSSGGTVDFKFARLESITKLTVATGGKVLRLHDTAFVDLANLNPGATPWIDLSGLGAADRSNLPFSFNRLTFTDPQGTPTRKNIKSSASTPLLRCLGRSTGQVSDRWGDAFNDEPGGVNVILWHTNAVTRTNPSGTYDTVEDALKALETVATSTLTVTLGQAMIDDVADFSTLPSNGATAMGPTVLTACLAPMVGKAVLDGDTDSTRRGKIVNCIIARGTVEETTAENCTFFDPGSAAITVSNIAGANCLIESGFVGSGSTLVTSVTSATTTFFVAASAYNFHLTSPGGNPAIDQGSALTVIVDLDGDPRGVDGNYDGWDAWDIGADELIVPTILSVTSTTADGSYGAGASINVTVNFSEPVTLAGGNLQISLNTGVAVTIAPFGLATSTSGTYVVASGHNSGDLNAFSPLTLAGGATLVNALGIQAALTIPSEKNLADLKDILVDTTPPTVYSVSSSTANGTYGVGAAINITVSFFQPVTLTGGNLRVTLDTGTVVNIPPFGPSNLAIGTYVVAAGQNSGDLTAVSPLSLAAGATLRDMAGNDAVLAIPSGYNLADLKAIVISTAPGAPPLPPTNVRTISYGDAIDVEWNASPSPNVAGYYVYRKLQSDPWPGTLLNTTGVVLNTKYRDPNTSGLQLGQTYVYRVVAVGY